MNDLANTHSFKLVSGPICVVRELTGKHQRILTSKNGKEQHSDRLNKVLQDVIVSVGEQYTITEDFVKNMLSCDKKKILTETRQFTLDSQDEFSFLYKYTDSNRKKQEVEIKVALENGTFPYRPLKLPVDKQCTEFKEIEFESYDQVNEAKKVTIELPRSKKEVSFVMLDGVGEMVGSATAKGDRSTHTILEMRRPTYLHKKEGGEGAIPVKLNLDTLSFVDIEFLRKAIKECEGAVDTEYAFEHPETEEDEYVDLISVTAFFFPSEAL